MSMLPRHDGLIPMNYYALNLTIVPTKWIVGWWVLAVNDSGAFAV
jgi:hypothetical protein